MRAWEVQEGNDTEDDESEGEASAGEAHPLEDDASDEAYVEAAERQWPAREQKERDAVAGPMAEERSSDSSHSTGGATTTPKVVLG